LKNGQWMQAMDERCPWFTGGFHPVNAGCFAESHKSGRK
jgi:hypothetical protein